MNQIRQHESGRYHKEKEEEYIRNISLKANRHSAAGVAGELLERISQLKKEANGEALNENAAAPPSQPNAESDDDEDGPYPAPAHEAYGPWVEVAAAEPTTTEVPAEFASTDENHDAPPVAPAPTFRIGAEDKDDEAEALAREQVAQSSKKATDAAWDALDAKLRKRGINKGKKRKRSSGI